MYIAPGKGQTTPWGQMLMSTESPYHFAYLLQVLKQSLHIFHAFPHAHIPGQGQTNFNVNSKALSFLSFVASFEKIPLNFDFIHVFIFFFMCQ